MGTLPTIDQTHLFILKRIMETGQAPFYTEVAAHFGVSVEEGRKAVRDVFTANVPGWQYPGTDYIVSYPPFNNLPTEYRITIDGAQKWTAQWGYEALAVSWLFPGKIVQIDAPCLDCGLPLQVKVKDGVIQDSNPSGIVSYCPLPFRDWDLNRPYSWSLMKLFRSEEHVRNWSGFKTGTDEGILTLPEVMQIFSSGLFTHRLDSDYVSRIHLYYEEVRKAFEHVAKGRTYWLIPKPYFVCPDCGYTAYGEAPETCQFCGATRDMFQRVD